MGVWKAVYGYEGKYDVSDTGHVRSVRRGKLLKPQLRGGRRQSYHKVSLSVNNKVKQVSVHRLVAEAFIDNPLNRTEVHHKDFNPKNNHVDNLEYRDRYNTRSKKANSGYITPLISNGLK